MVVAQFLGEMMEKEGWKIVDSLVLVASGDILLDFL